MKRPGQNESSSLLLTYFPQQSSAPKCWKSDQFMSHIYLQEQQKGRSSPDQIFTLLHWHTFFHYYLCCWFCSVLFTTCSVGNTRLVSFIWWTCLSWSLVWSSGDTNKPPSSGGFNTLKITDSNPRARQNETICSLHILSHVCSASLWVWWSWEDHVKLKNCHEMN